MYPRLDTRADQDLIDRVERLAARLSHPGAKVSRAAATRAALIRGLESFEAEPVMKPKSTRVTAAKRR